MSDLGDVAARLAELSDTDIAVVVRQATASRPGLAALHSAAEAVPDGAALPEPTETLPEIPEPAIPTSLDVPPPAKLPGALTGEGPAATPAARRIDREKVGEDKMEEIRASLRRTIRPDR
jgi:hypothetical protein